MPEIHMAARPAEVASELRRYIARHDAERRLNQRTIHILMARNCLLGQVVGRLRRDAARYEHNAELLREQRRHAIATNKKPELARAA